MTSKLLRTLAGEAVWPPPLWLMRQAGRHLPEYRAIRAKSDGLIQMCLTPDVAAEVTLQPVRRYGFDAAILFSDIIMLPYALGQDVRLVENKGPVLSPIRTAADMAQLVPGRLASVVAPILETVRRVRAALPGDTALIGFAGAPWTVVCYMVEGQGSRDFAEVRNLAYRDPALFDALMQLVTLATIDYLAQQIEAGVDVVMLFDSWAGVLPAAQFRRYVIEPTRQIVVALKQRYSHIPVIGFPRLAGAMLGEYALTGVQGVGVDTSADPVEAAGLVSAEIALQGNVDPLALLAGGEALADATRTVLESWRGRPFIFNLGHGVVPQTPPEHVVELARLVRAA